MVDRLDTEISLLELELKGVRAELEALKKIFVPGARFWFTPHESLEQLLPVEMASGRLYDHRRHQNAEEAARAATLLASMTPSVRIERVREAIREEVLAELRLFVVQQTAS